MSIEVVITMKGKRGEVAGVEYVRVGDYLHTRKNDGSLSQVANGDGSPFLTSETTFSVDLARIAKGVAKRQAEEAERASWSRQ